MDVRMCSVIRGDLLPVSPSAYSGSGSLYAACYGVLRCAPGLYFIRRGGQ